MPSALLTEIASYYGQRLREHGACARGVDWNGEASQTLRFEQLLKLLPSAAQEGAAPPSINDLGCGYGALLEHLIADGRAVDYCGYDLSAEMIAAAQSRHPKHPHAAFSVASHCERQADYCVASGLFNVRQRTSTAQWEVFIETVLADLDANSRRGFAFNCLTSYSDADRMRDDLYYGDPCKYFDYCKRRFSPHVALLHDYGLYEFTLLVRKEAP